MEPRDQYQRLRYRLNEQQFELPPQSWEQMADILDGKQPVPSPATRGRSRRRALLWLCFAGLLLGGLWLGSNGWPNSATAITTGALPIPLRTDAGAQALHKASKPTAPREQAPPQAMPSISTVGQSSTDAPTPPSTKLPAPLAPFDPLPARQPLLTPNDMEPPERPLAASGAPNPPLGTASGSKSIELAPIPSLAALELPKPAALLEAEGAAPVQVPRWHFGLKTGVDANTRQTTALIGGFARLRLSDKWAVQAELQYKTRSEEMGRGLGVNQLVNDTLYGLELNSEANRYERIERVHFFELPISVLYKVSPRLRLLGGGQLVYLRNQTQQAEGLKNDSSSEGAGVFTTQNFSRSQLVSPGLARFDAGLLAGLDYQISSAFSVDVRYVQGLFDLTNDSYYLEKDDHLNSSLQLSIKWIW